jgi:phosphohistidine swiveling domain-containing protein
MSCYLGSADLERYVEEGKIFLDREAAKKYIKEANAQCINHKAFFAKLRALNLQEASNELLLEYWRGMIDNYSHSVGYFRSTQEEPSRAIVEAVAEALSPDDAGAIMLSTELDEINKEEVAWEELVKKGFTRERALEHLKQFPWLFQNSLEYDQTVDELEQRLAGHVSRDIQQEKKELAIKQKQIIESHPELKELIETLHELAILRPEVKGCWGATGFHAQPVLKEISSRMGIDYQTLTFFYRSEDIDELLHSGKILSDEELAERKLCTAYIIESGVLRSFLGKEGEELERITLKTEDRGEITELKGASARKGKVTGVIHILKINNPEATKDFRASFTEGVLVTSMTQPNVVDIARRASAIVTDEGGMLCHAAIISREFGIPCVVGTHTATKDLKDGDLVEVDADAGVVRILKRNK